MKTIEQINSEIKALLDKASKIRYTKGYEKEYRKLKTEYKALETALRMLEKYSETFLRERMATLKTRLGKIDERFGQWCQANPDLITNLLPAQQRSKFNEIHEVVKIKKEIKNIEFVLK